MYFVRPHFYFLRTDFSAFLLDNSVGRIFRELWWTNQEIFPADIITLWFSMLIYHLGDKQYARWWPQLRVVVSLHRYDDDNDHHHHQVYVCKHIVDR
jgi:hypothetical protein